MSTTWRRALAWRMRRQLLDPVATHSVADVVDALGAVPAYPDLSAALAVGVRRTESRAGDVAPALEAGQIVKAYTFRGATHLMTPAAAAAYLALRASGRQWELPSWQQTYGLGPADWPAFREAVREALREVPLTREELGAAIGGRRRFRQAAAALTNRSDTLLKPLMWQGDICFGPERDGKATLRRLDSIDGWTGLLDVDEAGRYAVAAYLRAYGPAAPGRLDYWLGEGLSAGRKAIRRWLAELEDRLVTVDVEGDEVLVLEEYFEDLVASTPSAAVRLLPGQDQWVMGPGTADARVVPPQHRPMVSRGAHLVVAGGVVSGTWSIKGDRLEVVWFPNAGPVDGDALAAEVARLGAILGRSFALPEEA